MAELNNWRLVVLFKFTKNPLEIIYINIELLTLPICVYYGILSEYHLTPKLLITHF